MVGFSAGGHLAIATATSFEKRTYEPIDDIDKVSCRPDFAIPVYSGYLKAKDKDELAPGLRIPAGTPPVFLVHGGDDIISTPEHSVVMYLALKRAGVPAELHIYADAAHDFGVRPSDRPYATWTQSVRRLAAAAGPVEECGTVVCTKGGTDLLVGELLSLGVGLVLLVLVAVALLRFTPLRSLQRLGCRVIALHGIRKRRRRDRGDCYPDQPAKPVPGNAAESTRVQPKSHGRGFRRQRQKPTRKLPRRSESDLGFGSRQPGPGIGDPAFRATVFTGQLACQHPTTG